ncbi:HIT family protein [Paenibacillus beijingensis]|uniref:HIT family protein n=1 Tax=Paenibacillus beijingensis TaxID=1126833 RepID=UPI000698A49B|nr:hypothetical protein [Paenibacillus beijingensis]
MTPLNDLTYRQRSEYLLDMSLLGDAIQDALNPRRINYSIYGNTDTFLHAHVFPRYEWEPEERKTMPVWQYPKTMWTLQQYQYSETENGDMRKRISEKLDERMQSAYSS